MEKNSKENVFSGMLTQQEVAKIFGVTVRTVARWETRDMLIRPTRRNSRRMGYPIVQLIDYSCKAHKAVDPTECEKLGIPVETILQFHLPTSANRGQRQGEDEHFAQRKHIKRDLLNLCERISGSDYPDLAKAVQRIRKSRAGNQLLDCVAALLTLSPEIFINNQNKEDQ